MSKVNLLLSILLILVIDKVQCQDATLLPPVDYPIILAGSFGEIRSTHFHAGLDIKPSSKNALDTIIASDMGYVSRVKVNRSGYGRAVYLDHPNGYTTVYAHLQSFAPKLQAYVLSMQRAAESYEIDIYPNPGEIIFDRGADIGVLGNSGRSYGPHLHYEIRETFSEEPLNPILFGIGPVDSIPPTISSFITHTLSNDFEVLQRKTFAKNNIPEIIKIKGWRAGVGIAGYDQMNGAVNKNGIYETSLYVDDTLYYRQHLDRVSFYEMNQIKAHIDYSTKVNDKVTYALLYTAPGNNLMIIDSIRNKGVIRLFESSARKIKLITKDLSGNETIIKTSLLRDTSALDLNSSTYNLLAKYNKGGYIKTGNASLNIPAYSLAKDEKISVKMERFDGVQVYMVGDKSIPLLKSSKLSIKQKDTKDNRLIITQLDEGDLVDYGTQLIGDSLVSHIGSFGNYLIFKDTIPPVITLLSYPKPTKDFVSIKITDNVITKGKAKNFSYDVFINGNWTPIEFKELNKILYIPSSILTKGDIIKIIAEDQLHNSSELELQY